MTKAREADPAGQIIPPSIYSDLEGIAYQVADHVRAEIKRLAEESGYPVDIVLFGVSKILSDGTPFTKLEPLPIRTQVSLVRSGNAVKAVVEKRRYTGRPGPEFCTACNPVRGFRTKEKLKQHIKEGKHRGIVGNPRTDGPRFCKKCSAGPFANQTALLNHYRLTHKKKK